MGATRALALVLLLLGGAVGCGGIRRAPAAAHLQAPERPVVPPVHFVAPGDAGAVICLTQENADALAYGDLMLTLHIKALEALIRHCR
jgi:hypothetical protein